MPFVSDFTPMFVRFNLVACHCDLFILVAIVNVNIPQFI